MKKKFSKILGVGLTLALLFSLLLTAAPVAANVSSATVTVDPDEISEVNADYTIRFEVGKAMQADSDTITILLPSDTTVADGTLAGATLLASPGWKHDGTWITAPSVGTVTATGNATDRTVTFSMTTATQIGEGAEVRIKIINGITNPTEPGAYTLEVKTTQETTYVESESYDIDAPVVGGFVYVYNPSNILMATYGGSLALDSAATHFAKTDYTILVGAGTYKPTITINITGEGLTFKSSDGAEATIIDCTNAPTIAIKVSADDVVVEDFTIDNAVRSIQLENCEDVTVQNCIITDGSSIAVNLGGGTTGATITGNNIDDCKIGVYFSGVDDNTVSNNVITGSTSTSEGAITFEGGCNENDITGNTITTNEGSGIYFWQSASVCNDNLIKGNNISDNEAHGIYIDTTTNPTALEISENDITGNDDDGIRIDGWTEASDVIIFNNFSGNYSDNIDNDSTVAVNAVFNWWGSAVKDDITLELSPTTGTDAIAYDPWLTASQGDVVSAGDVATDATSLDAQTACGVKVSGVEDDAATPEVADVISAFKYAANPQDAIADAIAFYDVYVGLNSAFVIDETVTVKLRFYDTAITEASTVCFWTGDFWQACSDQDARVGLVWADVTEDTAPTIEELKGTPFVVVAGEAVEAVFGAPVLLAPEVGADTVSLTPTFAWGAVTGADGYYFEFADNANFVTPMVKLDGDLGRLIVTAYAYVTELPYSTAYYWRVKAVSGTAAAGDLMESNWASGVFITKAEPVEPTPPIVIEPYEPPDIVIEQPDIIVPLPDVSEITPSWIYVIIGVGAVLVIGLIVLIVRTRRVA